MHGAQGSANWVNHERGSRRRCSKTLTFTLSTTEP
jgi:hypothetical protein